MFSMTPDQSRIYLLLLMAKISKKTDNGFEIVSYYNLDEEIKWVIFKAQGSLLIGSSPSFVESEYFNVKNNIITIDHPEIDNALNCLSTRYTNSQLYAYMAAIAIKKNMLFELSPILDHTKNFLRIPRHETTLDSIRRYTAALRM